MLMKIVHMQERYVDGRFVDVQSAAYVNPGAITAVDIAEFNCAPCAFIRIGSGESGTSYRLNLDEWQRIEPLLVGETPIALPESVKRAWNAADIICSATNDADRYNLATDDLFQALGRIIVPDRFPIDGGSSPRPLTEDAARIYKLFFKVEDARDEWAEICDEDESDEDIEYQALEKYKDALRAALDAIRPHLDQIVVHMEVRTLSTTPKTESES